MLNDYTTNLLKGVPTIMFYQVNATLYFTEEDEATDFFHDCQLAILKSSIINLDLDNEERGIIQLLENNHDANPLQVCFLIEEVEA